MMQAVRAGQIRMIICYRLDRISRNTGDFAHLIQELEERITEDAAHAQYVGIFVNSCVPDLRLVKFTHFEVVTFTPPPSVCS